MAKLIHVFKGVPNTRKQTKLYSSDFQSYYDCTISSPFVKKKKIVKEIVVDEKNNIYYLIL